MQERNMKPDSFLIVKDIFKNKTWYYSKILSCFIVKDNCKF